MRNKLLLFLLLAACCTNTAYAQNTLPGRWKAEDNAGYIEIYQKGSRYYGKLLTPATDNGRPKLDVHNPDPALRSRTVQGIDLVRDMEDKGDGVYEDGTIYDPQSGKSYKCRLTVKGNRLEMRGYMGVSLLGKTVYWRRSK